MATLELTKEQIFDLVRQMPPEQQREMLLSLANEPGARAQRHKYATEQLRSLCATRGRDWDRLSEDEREAFVDDLIHEDRGCAS